jgi:ubiquinone/menaquinone biosynthesis C-methylase UbiE
MKINLLTSLPISWKKKSKKSINLRKLANINDRILSWKLDREYFDGTRAQGYAGYKFDGRWIPVSKDIIKYYNLKNNAKILDIGCAKGFLLDGFKESLKNPLLCGLDISSYAVTKSKNDIKKNLCIANATNLPYKSNYFDLVISINSLHNILDENELILAFNEMRRVAKKNIYITLGAYSNSRQKKTLDNWAVVASAYMHEKSWLKFFKKINYKGDFWWFQPE